jgi:phenylpyruvate tautomerase PptA (4-oxalocrotonate tautomerase family)
MDHLTIATPFTAIMRDWTMDMTNGTNIIDEPLGSSGLNRRAVLVSAAVAVGATVGVPPALADATPVANFGAPLVDVQVPAGVLSLEQKAAMIKGVTDVVLKAMKLSDPARKSFVQILETAEGGFGVNGQVFVPRGK